MGLKRLFSAESQGSQLRTQAFDVVTKAGVRVAARCHRRPLCERLSTDNAPLAGAIVAALADPRTERNGQTTFDRLEAVRADFTRSDHVVSQIDFGAGHRSTATVGEATVQTRRVADFVRETSKTPRQSALLYSLVRELRPQRVLEFGTAFGFSTAYMLAALEEIGGGGELITMEGAPEVADIARQTWDSVGLPKPEVVLGNFDFTLPSLLARQNPAHPFDLVFIDGNHRALPTVSYFHQLVPYLADPSLIIFDDIAWTADMQSAWRMVQQHPDAALSVDLVSMGLLVISSSAETRISKHRGMIA